MERGRHVRATEALSEFSKPHKSQGRQWLAALPRTSGSIKDELFEILPERSPSQLPGQLLDNPAFVQARLHEQGKSEVLLLPPCPCAVPQLGSEGVCLLFFMEFKGHKGNKSDMELISWSSRHWDMAQGSEIPPVPQPGALEGMLTFTAGASASRGTMETVGPCQGFHNSSLGRTGLEKKSPPPLPLGKYQG